MADYVEMDSQGVSNGIAAWEGAAQELLSNMQAALAKIAAQSGPGTWGADEAGAAFASSMHSEDVQAIKNHAVSTPERAIELATNLRTAATASLQSDAEAQALMDASAENFSNS